MRKKFNGYERVDAREGTLRGREFEERLISTANHQVRVNYCPSPPRYQCSSTTPITLILSLFLILHSLLQLLLNFYELKFCPVKALMSFKKLGKFLFSAETNSCLASGANFSPFKFSSSFQPFKVVCVPQSTQNTRARA